jgi:precorrin-6A/cobalt-precorrin-6A reductase
MARHRILILGGTTEARRIAQALASRQDVEVTLSLAGRTEAPTQQPVPVRVGGFGGAEGLARHLRAERVDLLIDATHPYAARMSANAASGAAMAGVRLLALRRPAWQRVSGDRWTGVADAQAAVHALGADRRRVFLALGRQEIQPFEAAPQHAYLVRSIDPIEPPLAVLDATYLLARGPFGEDDEFRLLAGHGIDAIVCKNSGGSATYGKVAAARRLGVEVIMLERPHLPAVEAVTEVGEVVAAVDAHLAGTSTKRGV